MITASEKEKLKVFLTVLVGVALIINYYFYHKNKSPDYWQPRQSPQQSAQAKTNALAGPGEIKQASHQTTNPAAQYIDITFIKPSDVQTVALSIATKSGKPNRSIQDALVRYFDSPNTKILTKFFKPTFIENGLFENTFNDTGDVPSKLELGKYLDGIVLARHHLEFSQSGAELENVITATIRLDVAVVPVSGSIKNQTRTFTANGVGFNQLEAQARAEERLIKQINDDPNKLSLK